MPTACVNLDQLQATLDEYARRGDLTTLPPNLEAVWQQVTGGMPAILNRRIRTFETVADKAAFLHDWVTTKLRLCPPSPV